MDKDTHPIIWDIRDLKLTPPEWAINPNEEVKTLKNYFVLFDGRDLIDILITALKKAEDVNENLIIESFGV